MRLCLRGTPPPSQINTATGLKRNWDVSGCRYWKVEPGQRRPREGRRREEHANAKCCCCRLNDKNNPRSDLSSCRRLLPPLSLMFVWDSSSLKHHMEIVFFCEGFIASCFKSSLSYSCSHSHTHAHTRTHARTRARAQSRLFNSSQ